MQKLKAVMVHELQHPQSFKRCGGIRIKIANKDKQVKVNDQAKLTPGTSLNRIGELARRACSMLNCVNNTGALKTRIEGQVTL